MIKFSRHSGLYTLETTQELNLSLAEAWDYFSSPDNLANITPNNMGFDITSKVDSKAYEGQIITYKVGVPPIPFLKVNWVTEITTVKDRVFFIDEQRFGPYAMWHHEHFFEELPNGKTLMKDKVSYKIPFGLIGHLAQVIFIKKQLKEIFSYRFKKLEELFG